MSKFQRMVVLFVFGLAGLMLFLLILGRVLMALGIM